MVGKAIHSLPVAMTSVGVVAIANRLGASWAINVEANKRRAAQRQTV